MRSGELTTTSLAAVCRRLGRQQATGCLVVTRGGDTGRVLLRDGLVVGAVAPGAGDRLADRLVGAGLLDAAERDGLPGPPGSDTKLGELLVERDLVTEEVARLFLREGIRDALGELLGWREGSYRFEPGAVTPTTLSVELPVPRVLLEVSRRLRSPEAVPDPEAVPEPTTTGTQQAVTLRPEELTLLAHVDGRRSVRALAGAVGQDESTAGRIVAGLHLLGVITLPAPDAGARPGAPQAAASDQPPSPPRVVVSPPEPPEAHTWVASASSVGEPEVWEVDVEEPAAEDREEGPLAAAASRGGAGEQAGESVPDEAAEVEQTGSPPEDEPAGQEAGSGRGRPERSSDEVSAFLRELSRLSTETPGSSPGRRGGPRRRQRDERERDGEDDG